MEKTPLYLNSKTSKCLPFRSSRWQMLLKIGILKSYAIFTGKHLCWCVFLTTLQA